jgi:hypothetical protein
MGRELVVVALALTGAAPARAIEVPVGTTLAIRLTTRVSSHASRPGDFVEAVLVAPVEIDGQPTLPAGWTLRGTVREAGKQGGRASLRLGFPELVDEAGRVLPISARVLAIDDSRESVAPDGRIVGFKPIRPMPSRFVTLLMLAAYAHPVALLSFEAGRLAFRAAEHAAIDYPPGVEMTLALEAPLQIGPQAPAAPPPALDSGLATLARTLPFRTRAARLRRDSDLTNVLLVGSQAQVESAFVQAGWTRAGSMCFKARFTGLLALATKRAYRPAPVSRLELEKRPPDLVFEKQNDTLTKRHHVRIWLRSEGEGLGEAVWVGAATHDIGLNFDRRDRVITHRIDPLIDRERDKIVNDLELTGRVVTASLVDRPDVPRGSRNATGDAWETDGRMAVVVLRPAPAGPRQD